MDSTRWKRVVVALVLGLFAFVGLGGWALASPVGAAPDDDYHLASIWCAGGEREGICEAGSQPDSRVVPEWLTISSHCYAFQEKQSAACVPSDDATNETTRGNFAGAYPPVFYAVMTVFAGEDIALSTVLMRLFNAALFIGVIISILAFLKPGQRGALLWSAVATLVPLGMFIVPSVNPSSWAVLSGLTVWIALTGYFTADRRVAKIVLGSLALLLAVMGAGARGDAGVYVAFGAVVAAVLTFERSRNWLKQALVPLGVIVIGAAFFLASGQSAGAAASGVAAGQSGGGSQLGLLMSNFLALPSLWVGHLGTWNLGWLDTPMRPAVWAVMVAISGAVVFWGIRVLGWRKAVSLAMLALVLIAFPLYILHGLRASVGTEVQPRYLLPLMVMFVGVAVWGLNRDDLGLGRVQAAVVFVGVAFANSLALHATLRRYITGTGENSFNLNARIEWWWSIPVQPLTVWILASTGFALLMLGLYAILFTERGRRLFPLSEAAYEPALDAPQAAPVLHEQR